MTAQLTPFIWLDGEGQEAIRFYEQALGAEVVFSHTYGESPETPDDWPAEAKNRLDHSVLVVDGAKFYVADLPPDQTTNKGSRVAICLEVEDVETAERYFAALAKEGQVKFPFRQIYFSPGYGEVVDKFGAMFLIYTKKKQA